MLHSFCQHLLSKCAGKVATCRWRWVKNTLINRFATHYRVDLRDAKREHRSDYTSFHDFFTRMLKDNARPIDDDPQAIISPADGTVSMMGKLVDNQLIQAKGQQYTLEQLLANDIAANSFYDGHFATIYLSPKDYHRVHMPITGTLTEMRYVPGKLFPVKPTTVSRVSGLFARNERVICHFDTAIGPVAVIFVGALIVGSIVTSWQGTINHPRGKSVKEWQYQTPITFNRGDELGYFTMGSTVIVLLPKGQADWLNTLNSGATLRMGQPIGKTQ